jgi:TRAP-type transport system small permease protein
MLIRKFLDKIIELFCISTLALMTVLITWQVITRYIFNKPSVVTEQSSQYLFVWLVLYGAAYVFGKKDHMHIGFVKDKMPLVVQKILDVLIEVIVGLFALSVMVYGGYLAFTAQMVQRDAALQIPMGVIYSAIPMSGLFILLYSILNMVAVFKQSSPSKGGA